MLRIMKQHFTSLVVKLTWLILCIFSGATHVVLDVMHSRLNERCHGVTLVTARRPWAM